MSYTKNKVKNTIRKTITFQPSEGLGMFIDAEVSSGRYQNQSEVVREGLRLLEEREAESKLRQLKK